MADSFEQLRAEFLAETEDTLRNLQRDLNELGETLESQEVPVKLIDRVFRTTHSLKGVAGMFGLARISAVSHSLENVFEGLRRGDFHLDRALLDLLHRGNEALHELLAGAAAGSEDAAAPTADAVLGDIDAALAERRPPDVAGPRTVAATIEQLDPAERDAVRRAVELGRTVAIVEAALPEHGFEVPFRELLTVIRDWGTVHGTVSDEADATDATFRVRLVASGPGELFGLMKTVGPLGAEVLVEDVPLPPTIPAATTAPAELPREVPIETVPTAPPAPEVAPLPSAPDARRSTLRVPVDRVDRLMTELADLVQAKLHLDETADLLLETTDRMSRTLLKQSLRSLDRHIRTIQESILEVRLVSLDSLFQKLERAFRDACRVTGKEARLGTSGATTELDKEVVEALAEPLLHLVRNAVDHGLETEAVRRAAGKDPVGTVRLTADSEGSFTILEVSDDGAGIDFERVEARGRERGLLDPQDDPTPAELRELLFRPGFTVKETATEISGRGVGLDAVRDAVSAIGGTIEIDEGRVGTVFRLRVPISLAITQALEVDLAGQAYLIPLSHVRRVLHVGPAELGRVDDQPVYLFEDRVIPVASPPDGPARPGDGKSCPAVLLGLADRRLLLPVERVGRRREIVVRSLGSLLPDVPGVAGCTELGDGRTLLILDPVRLFETGGRAVEASA